jgi:hypothetical protein
VLESKLALGHVARISLPQDGVTVTGNDLATLEGRPDVLFDSLVRRFFTDLGLHLAKPDKDFLVGETVERPSETIEGSAVSKEGIRESGANEFASVSRNITALMVTRG